MNTPPSLGRFAWALVALTLLPSCALMRPELNFGPALGAALAAGRAEGALPAPPPGDAEPLLDEPERS